MTDTGFARFVHRAASRLRARPDIIQAITVITLAVLEETARSEQPKTKRSRKAKKKTRRRKGS